MSLMSPTSAIPSSIIGNTRHSLSENIESQSIDHSSPSIDPRDDIEKLLQDSLHRIEYHSLLMKKALDQDQIIPAFQCASAFLNELRTSLLSPKLYYQLYMAAFDALRDLSIYLDTFPTSMVTTTLSDLYELVQYTGNIVPRLYLMIVVGSSCLKHENLPLLLIRDMINMMKGVQHPTRGLFLRYYWMNMIKDPIYNLMSLKPKELFPELVPLIIENFSEMNRLWIRLSSSGPSWELEKRQQERQELETLIGSNIVRLGQLVEILNPKPSNITLSLDLYKHYILDKIAYELNCEDSLAQEYVFESVIQVFPDEYHLMTLSTLITMLNQFNIQTSVCSLYKLLIDRMALYSILQPVYNRSTQEEQEFEERKGEHIIPGNIRLFDIFFREISTWLIREKRDIDCFDMISLAISLQNLSLQCYPNNISNIKKLYSFISEYLESLDPSKIEQTLIIDLILAPSSNTEIFIDILSMDLSRFLSFQSRILLSKKLVECISKYECISNVSKMETILSLCDPLLDNIQSLNIADLEQLVVNQQKICIILNLFSSDDHHGMIRMLYEKCLRGSSLLYRFTGVVLVRKLLLWAQYHDRDESLGELALEMAMALHTLPQECLAELGGSLPTNAFGHLESWAWLQGLLEMPVAFLGNEIESGNTMKLNWFSSSYASEASLRCLLDIVRVYSDNPNIAKNAWINALIVYEEGIVDSFAQHASLCLIIDMLIYLSRTNAAFIKEDVDMWIDKLKCYSKRNLRKILSCNLLGRCALLYCPKIVSYGEESRPKESIILLEDAFRSIKGNLYISKYECQCCKENTQNLIRVVLCIDLISVGLYILKYFAPLLSSSRQLLNDMFAMVTEQSCMKSNESFNNLQHVTILKQQFEYVKSRIESLKTMFQSILSNRNPSIGLVIREHVSISSQKNNQDEIEIQQIDNQESSIEQIEEELKTNLSFSSDFNESGTAVWRQEQ